MTNVLAESIAGYFISHCTESSSILKWLELNYLWPDSEAKRVKLYRQYNELPWVSEKIEVKDSECYRKTKLMKESISIQLCEARDMDEKLALTSFFIEKWGGIARKVDKSVPSQDSNRYYEAMVRSRSGVRGISDDEYSQSRKGERTKIIKRFRLKYHGGDKEYRAISSWSKFMAIAYPDWAFIYDARVAYSINSIIFLGNLYNEELWTIPLGRNAKLNFIDIETLILSSQWKSRNLDSVMDKLNVDDKKFVSNFRKKLYIDQDATYSKYLCLINEVHSLVSEKDVEADLEKSDVEALLFTLSNTKIFSDVLDKASKQ